MEFKKDDKISFKVRMPIDLRLELGIIAKTNGMTLNKLVNTILNEYIHNNKNVKK